MSHEFPAAQIAALVPAAAPGEDARDLQLRLYREIGIAAVAAALQVRAERAETEKAGALSQISDLPAILRGEDLAA